MNRPIRLTALMTHPIQYMAPWFRHIAAHRPDLDLTVLYGALPDKNQQGAGFGKPFAWDVPLTDGYRFEVCSDATVWSFESDHFRGLDVHDIDQRLRETRPDVVLIPGWHSIMQARALRACRRFGVPVLYRGDSTLFSGPRGLLRPVWSLRTRNWLRRFDGYLSVGTHADRYLRSFGIADPLIARSPHCVDNERFAAEAARLRRPDSRASARTAVGATASDFVVLFAGKFTERKRPLDAVRAVAPLGRSAVLMMAGDGPLLDASRAEAERLGIRVACTGFLNQSELPSAFAAADCVLVPSAWESWGLIVNEALASGVPCVVTTRVACAPDLIVEGQTGYAVEPGDVPAMTTRLESIRDRIAEGHEFGRRCREQAETCSLAVAAEGLAVLSRRVTARSVIGTGDTRIVACCGAMVSVYGAERLTFEVLRGLREQGASVHCIVNSWDSSSIADLAASIGASWRPGHYVAWLRLRAVSFRERVHLAWDIARVGAVLLRECHRLRATHVFVPDMAAALWNLPALVLLRVLGVPVIMRVGNAPGLSRVYRAIWGRLINGGITRFVPNSRFSADALRSTGVPAKKIRVVRNTPPTRSVDVVAIAEPPGDAFRIIYVGQLIPAKGCDRLMEAVAQLVHRGSDVCLDLVGDTDRWEPPAWAGFIRALQERARGVDLQGRVRFLGAREDVPALLAAASVHCLPSLIETREGFGNVAMEAKAAGRPSVVTPSGGLPELIAHQQDGFICADDSVGALVDGLEYFLRDRETVIEAGHRARASAKHFSRERFRAEWGDLFGMNPPYVQDSLVSTVVQRHAD
jgi:glycosyltransferase involved in cell wall biosynthesis